MYKKAPAKHCRLSTEVGTLFDITKQQQKQNSPNTNSEGTACVM